MPKCWGFHGWVTWVHRPLDGWTHQYRHCSRCNRWQHSWSEICWTDADEPPTHVKDKFVPIELVQGIAERKKRRPWEY